MSEFSIIYEKFDCMHASILHVLSQGLTGVDFSLEFCKLPLKGDVPVESQEIF